MFTILFTILTAASVAVAVCALFASLGGRPVVALCGFSSAFCGNATALTLPDHRCLWASAILIVCALVMLVDAVVTAARRVQPKDES